jgi:hypothetical protein
MANTRLTPKGEGTSVTLVSSVSRSELGVDYLRTGSFFYLNSIIFIFILFYFFSFWPIF